MCPVLERVQQGPDCTKQTGVDSSQKEIQALKPQSYPPSHLNPEPLRPLGMLGRKTGKPWSSCVGREAPERTRQEPQAAWVVERIDS